MNFYKMSLGYVNIQPFFAFHASHYIKHVCYKYTGYESKIMWEKNT